MGATQKQLIYQYLTEHKEGITPLVALKEFGCMRLAARISDIRSEYAARINTELVMDRKPNGKVEKYSRYYLASEEDENEI